MNLVSRGIRNAFRNSIRTLAISVILGLSIGLSLTMLIANKAVSNKITSVKSSIGNTISISAAGTQGFQGGGDPLDESKVASLSKISHVSSVTELVEDQLRNSSNTNRQGTTTEANTSLTSAIDAGSLGQRFGGGSASTSDSTTADGAVPGVGMMSFAPPISAYGTTDPTTVNGTNISLKNGNTISGAADKAVALVGSTVAAKNNLQIGSTFTVYGETINVAGIFDTGTTFANNAVILSLPTLQRLSGQTGQLSSATATVDSVNNIDSVASTVKSALGSSADVTSSKDSVASAIEPLNSVKSIASFSLVGATVAGAIIILLTMIMIVRERKREIGVVKAIGGSNIRIAGEFMVESLTLALLGAVVGLIIGVVGGQPVTKLLVNNSTATSTTASVSTRPGTIRSFGGSSTSTAVTPNTPPTGFGGGFRNRLQSNQTIRGISDVKTQVGLSILAYGFAAALLIAVIGSGLAAVMISKVRPSTVMRAE